MFTILFLYALCASTFTICKAVLLYAKPFFFVGIRMSAAGILLLTYQGVRYGFNSLFQWSDRWDYLQIILFHVYITYMFDLWSLQYLSSLQSSFIYNLSPFLAALFSYFIFDERMTSKKWVGLGLGMVGFFPQLYVSAFDQGSGFATIMPMVILMLGVGSAMYGWTIVRKLINDKHYSPSCVNGIAMLGGGILALVTSLFVEGWYPAPVSDWFHFIFLTALIILVANIIFYNLYGELLKRYTSTFLAFAGFVTPFFAACFGWFFLGEGITISLFFSLLTVSAGLYIFYQEELRQGYFELP